MLIANFLKKFNAAILYVILTVFSLGIVYANPTNDSRDSDVYNLFLGMMFLIYCFHCLYFLVMIILHIYTVVKIFKLAKKFNYSNPLLWSLISFFFPNLFFIFILNALEKLGNSIEYKNNIDSSNS